MSSIIYRNELDMFNVLEVYLIYLYRVLNFQPQFVANVTAKMFRFFNILPAPLQVYQNVVFVCVNVYPSFVFQANISGQSLCDILIEHTVSSTKVYFSNLDVREINLLSPRTRRY